MNRIRRFAQPVALLSLLSMLALCATAAGAQTLVFSNFIHRNQSNDHSGPCIKGPAATILGSCASWLASAAPFVPSASGTLDSIDVAAGQYSGTRGIVVTLVVDKGGSPSLTDPILESWVLADKEKNCCNYKLQDKLKSAAHPALVAGSTYWVVMSPLGFDSFTLWQRSWAIEGTFLSSSDGGAHWYVDTGVPPAFDVWVQ